MVASSLEPGVPVDGFVLDLYEEVEGMLLVDLQIVDHRVSFGEYDNYYKVIQPTVPFMTLDAWRPEGAKGGTSAMSDAMSMRSLISQQSMGGYHEAMGYQFEHFIQAALREAFPTAKLVDVGRVVDSGVDMIMVNGSTRVLIQAKITSVPTSLPPSLFLQVANALRSFAEVRDTSGDTSAVLITNYRTSEDMDTKMRMNAVFPITFDLDEPVSAIRERILLMISALLTELRGEHG